MSSASWALAAAPAWWIVLAGAGTITGVGSGCLDLGVNQLFAYSFGVRAGTMPQTVLNGVFGIGAVAGPLIVAAIATGGIG